MAGRRKKLWGYTRIGAHEIKIYKRYSMPDNDDGHTTWGDKGTWIDLNARVFGDPARLDEVLIHEFLHVLEYVHGPTALQIGGKDSCSAGVQVIGHGLAQMLRELRQVGAEDSTS